MAELSKPVKTKKKKGDVGIDLHDVPQAGEALGPSEISMLLGKWEQVNAARITKSAALREQIITLQAELDNIEAPFKHALTELEKIVSAAIIERGGTDGIVSDVKVVYTKAHERRSVNLDGLWDLRTSMPKVWKVIKGFLNVTGVEARVKIGGGNGK
jgi:hypothetical protein